jgi:hypothetical protein
MPKSTLFPLEREPLKPSLDRREPVLWLRRLVILSSLDCSAVIRNIPFRRGLNIIRTRQMESQGGPVAGHSVGKTLLMRLIRYTLGEPTFGSEETQQSIAAAKGLESAIVVAHWTISGADWIVVRTLKSGGVDESFAVCSDNWQQAVDSPNEKQTHRDFVQTVNDAVLADLPKFTLPRGREAKWLDVLAWLSRDYQCGYRRANDWRHEESNSGPSLDRDENSLVMQWVMGLMNAEEVALRVRHNEILKKRADQKRAGEREQKRIETLWKPLQEKLELPAEIEVESEQRSFDSVKPKEVVEGKVASLERLKKDRTAASRVAEFKTASEQAAARVTEAEGTIREHRAVIEHIKKQIDAYEADPTRPFARCQADPCWIKERAKATANDPSKDTHLSDLHEQQAEAQQKLKDVQKTKTSLVAAVEAAKKLHEDEEKRLAAELSAIDQSIGKWKGYEPDAKSFQTLVTTAARTTKTIKRVDDDIDASLQTQDDIRKKDRRKLNRLSEVYEQILQEIFGPEATGKIQVDGNGLQPVPDKKLAPAGAALSVMTTVLAFDVTSLAASVYGLGEHPRFLMHDSPREGDMEGPLFRRLFEIVHELETQFTDPSDISFQYIVTTTSEPPAHLANPKGQYVVETLEATSENGRLLRRMF